MSEIKELTEEIRKLREELAKSKEKPSRPSHSGTYIGKEYKCDTCGRGLWEKHALCGHCYPDGWTSGRD